MKALLTKTSQLLGILTAVGVIVVVFVLIWMHFSRSQEINLPGPDTPPGEYLYLDNERVLAYLGQLLGGLSPSETHTDSLTEALTAGLTGGELAQLSAAQTRSATVLRIVSPSASDRFYRLLVALRNGRTRRPWIQTIPLRDQSTPWLYTLDGHPASDKYFDVFLGRIGQIHEGDFVRIVDAHLLLPAFAALFRKTRYAALWHPRGTVLPRRPPYFLSLHAGKGVIRRYLALLGPDMTLPFVVPVSVGPEIRPRMVVFVPARYSRLADNARLLAGNLTIVGKVIYKDPRLPGDNSCHDVRRPCRYVDRQTISTYAGALVRAPDPVRSTLGYGLLPPDRIEATVRRFVRFDTPVVVVLPIAIYQ